MLIENNCVLQKACAIEKNTAKKCDKLKWKKMEATTQRQTSEQEKYRAICLFICTFQFDNEYGLTDL